MWYEGVRSAHIMSITVKKYVCLALYPFDWIQGAVHFDLTYGIKSPFLPIKDFTPPWYDTNLIHLFFYTSNLLR